jgi:hypothetical protein
MKRRLFFANVAGLALTPILSKIKLPIVKEKPVKRLFPAGQYCMLGAIASMHKKLPDKPSELMKVAIDDIARLNDGIL